MNPSETQRRAHRLVSNLGLVGALGVLAAGCAHSATSGSPDAQASEAASKIDVQQLSDAYVYLLGRAIVVRQEISDLKEPGVDYNTIKYNPVGSAEFVNPNLDVAYLEAWIAVDDATPAILEIPRIEGRYYTAQLLDEWGEVITNINERTFPDHPYGTYALVAPNSEAAIPDGAVRVELHSYKAKMLARVELKDDRDGAIALQRQFALRSAGNPKVAPPVALPDFSNQELMGVEIFASAEELLGSAGDVSPIAGELQAKVRAVAALANDPAHRDEIDVIIKETVVPNFLRDAVTKSGKFENNWLGTLGTGNYGADYRVRASANLVGLWANNNDEVVYFVATQDASGEALSGDHAYLLGFPAEARPEHVVDAYWSIILVDVPDYRVVPNRLHRYNFNDHSGLETEKDGSLRILIASEPKKGMPESNWLPSPESGNFSLTFRTYVPKDIVKKGDWFPPALERID